MYLPEYALSYRLLTILRWMPGAQVDGMGLREDVLAKNSLHLRTHVPVPHGIFVRNGRFFDEKSIEFALLSSSHADET